MGWGGSRRLSLRIATIFKGRDVPKADGDIQALRFLNGRKMININVNTANPLDSRWHG